MKKKSFAKALSLALAALMLFALCACGAPEAPAAAAVKKYLAATGKSGTVIFFGRPGEEGGAPRRIWCVRSSGTSRTPCRSRSDRPPPPFIAQKPFAPGGVNGFFAFGAVLPADELVVLDVHRERTARGDIAGENGS